MGNKLVQPGINQTLPAPPREVRDCLESWKEIASYLRREVRTVQLWEKREGLPVHRHFHKQLGSVYALRSEIESWKRRVSVKAPSPQPLNANGSVAGESSARVSVLVSPLANPTGDARWPGLGQALVDATATSLQQASPGQLEVRTSNSNEESESADFILKWSLEEDRKLPRVDVSLQLVKTGSTVWSQSFLGPPRSTAAMAAYVSDQIVRCLWLKVFSPRPLSRTFRRQEKPGSREAYLRGRYFWNQRSEEGLRKAVHTFESAIQQDPEYAQLYSGLADSLTLLSFYEIVPSFQAMPAARRAALKAIDLDPSSAEAHASLGDVLFHFDRDWQGADSEYRRSIQCNPGYALGYHWYSNLLAARGQHEAAHIAIMQALEIDPVSIITLVWAGVTSHLAHNFDDAIEHYKKALELDPHFVWAHMYMAQALEQKASFGAALGEFETTMQLAGGSNSVRAMKAHTYAVAGDKSSARAILRELKGASPGKYVPSFDIAATHAALGESDQMLKWLNRACNERNMKVFILNQDPRFDACRGSSEFKKVVERMGLTECGR
jgi:tetratricopeptide (TPR) repeat protein